MELLEQFLFCSKRYIDLSNLAGVTRPSERGASTRAISSRRAATAAAAADASLLT